MYRLTDTRIIQSQHSLTFFWQFPFTEGELEAEWLQDVGLSTLISGDEEEDGKALLSTLTRTQAAAVKKRYNTYTQTLRKKNKQSVRDVRDIFGASESPVSNGQGSKDMFRGAEENMEKNIRTVHSHPLALKEKAEADSNMQDFINLSDYFLFPMQQAPCTQNLFPSFEVGGYLLW